jgi:hypothetical protein
MDMTASKVFTEFVAAFERGEDPHPLTYFERLQGRERFELEGMIERYLLADAPREPYDADAFEAAKRTPAMRRVAEAAAEPVDASWPTLLPRLRAHSGLKRRDLSARLADRLGLAGHEELVDAAYHDMERGEIGSSTVANEVLDALSDLLGATAERLRRAGKAATGGPPHASAVFARGLAPSSDELALPAAADTDERDEAARARVEELFYRGHP